MRSLIDDFTKRFTDEKITDLIEVQKKFFHANPELVELNEKLSANINREPVAIGTFLGEVKKKEFKPSVALLDMLADKTDRKITVDDNGEWLFLCGRDMFGNSVLRWPEKYGTVLVQNLKDEVLGYGTLLGNPQERSGTVAVKTLLDRGDFLRREK